MTRYVPEGHQQCTACASGRRRASAARDSAKVWRPQPVLVSQRWAAGPRSIRSQAGLRGAFWFND